MIGTVVEQYAGETVVGLQIHDEHICQYGGIQNVEGQPMYTEHCRPAKRSERHDGSVKAAHTRSGALLGAFIATRNDVVPLTPAVAVATFPLDIVRPHQTIWLQLHAPSHRRT